MSELQTAVFNMGTVLCNPQRGGGSSLQFSEAAELLYLLSDADGDALSHCAEAIGRMADTGCKLTRADWDALRGHASEDESVEEETATTEEPASETESDSTDESEDDRDESGGQPE